MHAPGVYIGFAGPNNIGKTTQSVRLARYITDELGREVERIKFPMYDLLPHGPTINRYFRDPIFRALEQARRGVEEAEKHVAAMVVANHHHFEETLQEKIAQGRILIVEDCVMNSVAWTIHSGYTLEKAMEMHRGLYFGDVTVLLNELSGSRYTKGIEKGHVNEESEQRQTDVRNLLLDLAEDRLFQCERVDFELGWSEETVFSYVLQAIKTRIVI